MHNGGYRGGPTTGGKWGCALSAIVGVPLIFFSFIISALGDCLPDVPCKHGLIWQLFLLSILIAGGVGLGSRAAINWFLKKRRSDR
jgi:hypothetical protein